MSDKTDWRRHGVRVVKGSELDTNTAQTPGMNRAAAITHARTGAEKLWAGTVVIHPKARTGAHHHGPVKAGHRAEFLRDAIGYPFVSESLARSDPLKRSLVP